VPKNSHWEVMSSFGHLSTSVFSWCIRLFSYIYNNEIDRFIKPSSGVLIDL